MGKFFDEIPAYLIPWIQQQKIFWVATAPLSAEGHVNVSPKGIEGTFHVENDQRVWYEDLTGSGVETIAHLKENGRITVLLTAFEGPPRIVRLFGRGAVYEFGTPEYEALIPVDKRLPGSRSVIVLDVHKVGTSCGFSIPFFTFKSNRTKLHSFASRYERVDVDAEASCTIPDAPSNNGTYTTGVDTNTNPDSPPSSTPNSEIPLPERGLRYYWKTKNEKSIDGLPGITEAHHSRSRFSDATTKKKWADDDESLPGSSVVSKLMRKTKFVDERTLIGFIAGVAITAFLSRFSNLVVTWY